MTAGRPIVRGLQVERTQLAWERTAVGPLAASVFLVVHPDQLGPARLMLALAALGLAAGLGVVGRLRAGQIVRARRADPRPTGAVPSATRAAAGLCCVVVIFAASVAVLLAL